MRGTDLAGRHRPVAAVHDSAALVSTSPARATEADVRGEHVRLVTTADGPVEVRAYSSRGEWIRLHSLHSPVAEAQTIVDRALAGGEVPPVVAVVGPGLGFIVDDLVRRRADVRIVALEVLPELVPAWTERADVREWLASGRLVIGRDPQFELPNGSWPASATAADPLLIVPPVVAYHWPAAVERARRACAQFMFERRANEEARQRLAPLYFRHTLTNLPSIAGAPDVRVLDGIASGEPVVLCGAGPSIERLLPELRANRAKAWYVALDTALRPLMAAGIVPDLVVSIDPTPLNGRHLVNLPLRDRPWLVAEGSLDPRAQTTFAGRTLTCRINQSDPWPWLESLGLAPTKLLAWGSVLTTACDLIVRMKPASVAFAGIDLAYTNGQPYCRGTSFEEDWELQRIGEGHASVEDVWRARLDGRTIPEADVHGVRTRTAGHLIAFRNWARTLAATREDIAFANVTAAGILHGDRIAQVPLTDWLGNRKPLATPPAARLERSAHGSHTDADTLAEAVRTAIGRDDLWTGWNARVPRLDRGETTRVLQAAAQRLRARKAHDDMTTSASAWIDVPFDAANFLGQGDMQWTVSEKSVETYAYQVVGKTMTLSFKISNSSVGGAPSRELYLRLPQGYLPARGAANAVWIASQPTREMGYATVHPGLDLVVVHRSSEQAFPIDHDGFCLFGQLIVEVQ